MNLTDLITDICEHEGLYSIRLPFKEPVEVIVQKAIEKSVRTFSEFKRQVKEAHLLVSDLKSPSELDRMKNIYLLPADMCTTTVKDVMGYCETDRAADKNVTTNTFTVGSPFVGFGAYYPQDILNAQLTGTAINKFAGVTSRRATVKYLGYNKIQLFDFPKDSSIFLSVECEHDLSCESIPESCRESFLRLAYLDTGITALNSLENIEGMGSGYKEIRYKIDKWSGYKDKREALVKEWTDTWYLDDEDSFLFF